MVSGTNPALTIALALAAGIVAQSAARHIRLPGIVLLLATGIALGPDGLGILWPDDLGRALHILVGFAVAVILFEGGLNLNWRRLRREAATIRLLVSLGAVITAVGGTVFSHLILGWNWQLSILFGTLVIVTGPTVITPLLRRIKVRRNLETVLEAEGVIIDAVGAVVAIVTLEVVLRQATGASLAIGFFSIPSRLFFGILFGIAGGGVMAFLLRFRAVIPEGLENVFILSLVLLLYQLSNMIVAETGIASAVVAGLVVGNARIQVQRELREFKEQLTVLLIGMLFVLLAADVTQAEASRIGRPGLLIVLALMFIVRPVNVLACTLGSKMSWREKLFLCWLAPRGIVAAAVATLFNERLGAAGMQGGEDMRALVFFVIAFTVLFQGGTGGLVARWLGVRRPTDQGYAILGAHPLGRALARTLLESKEEVVLIDADAVTCRQAEDDGFRVIYGNALEDRVLLGADIESRKAAVAILSNEAVNLLFAQKARGEHKVPKAYIAIQRGRGSIDATMVEEAGGRILFGQESDLELWSIRIRRGIAAVETWRKRIKEGESQEDDKKVAVPKEMQNTLLPLTLKRGEAAVPVDDSTELKADDEVAWLVFTEQAEDAHSWLEKNSWRLVQVPLEEHAG
ncbi:MAG: sodium:proton antiporter [Candidatus Latescibacteria bacterium]|nr:sodium:proton antiporter [Candidatus Latescibacterota bacterium]NIM64747.1 sodium:proton antiporter [Candidatus Latescibacterota bacterium]NIO01257.1 sodium:proton antiporter [Candidatus Latescibacterota bacterium]NIO27642.1 sodium:proton antiporter [Candidatus Latescibacterota bacterium]NIO55174.1 sodium:proton antiporter [Candidatus Latescibacterota bacterium]